MRTRRLTEGGVLAAITVVLGWLAAYVPMVGMLVPAPVAILIYRHGLGTGIMAWVTVAILDGLLLGNVAVVLVLALMGFVAVGLGEALRLRLAAGRTLLLTIGASLIYVVLFLAASGLLFGVNPIDASIRAMREALPGSTSLYRRLGAAPDMLQQFEAQTQAALELLPLLIPMLVGMMAVVIAFVNFWISRIVLQRLGEQVSWFRPFQYWSSSRWVGVLGVASLFMWASAPHGNPWSVAGLNLFYLAIFAAVLQGLVVGWYWLTRWSGGGPARLLGVLAVLFLGPLAMWGLALAGALDPWLDLRGLRAAESHDGDAGAA